MFCASKSLSPKLVITQREAAGQPVDAGSMVIQARVDNFFHCHQDADAGNTSAGSANMGWPRQGASFFFAFISRIFADARCLKTRQVR